MVTKAQISLVSSLQHKKFRREHGLFVAEGIKSIREFAFSDYRMVHIYYTAKLAALLEDLPPGLATTEVSGTELEKMSGLKTPQGVLALLQLPANEVPDAQRFKGCHSLLLDGIQDPGNLGTIIRTADWFGIRQIICSADTADVYNPKVIQASMGSVAHIDIAYTVLAPLLEKLNVPVYGAFLGGESVYNVKFGGEGVLVLGNEGNGISKAVTELIDRRITIPRFGKAESLNVAISAGILCSLAVGSRQ